MNRNTKNKKFDIWYYVLLTISFIVGWVALDMICTYNAIELFMRYRIVIACGFIITYGYFIYDSVRQQRYADKTDGRNYQKDHRKYKRSFAELAEYFSDADPHKMDTSVFKQEDWRDTEGIILGKTEDDRLVKIPSDAEANIAVFGSPGSSKTTGIAIPSAMSFSGSVLAVDIKGDIYNFCKNKRKILRFCPDLKDAQGNSIALQESKHFNPFAGMKEMNQTERKLFLMNMAATLIPEEGGNEGNYFTSRARKIFQGIVQYMFYLNPDITFPEVLHAILHPGQQGLVSIPNLPYDIFEWVQRIMRSGCMDALEQVGSLYGNNEKNVSGAFDALTTALLPYSNTVLDELLDGKGDCISINDLEDGYDIYLQISQENLNAYAPLFTMIFQNFMDAFTRRPDTSSGIKNRPILMLLDEFPQLTFSYHSISQALSTLRSKGIICMLLQQNMSQLEYKYGSSGSYSLVGNCTYQICLKANDPKTQDFFSKLLGTEKVLRFSNTENSGKGNGKGRSLQEARDLIYQPEDLGDLGEYLVILYNGKRIKAKKIYCFK